MREIKFRALRKTKNKSVWWYSTDGGCFLKNNHKGVLCLYEQDNFEEDVFIGEATQHTGLKDKNGVEIYEGDIVKWGHIKNREECWHRVAKVKMFPSLHFKILYYIDGETLEPKKGDNYEFHYGNFIYQDTHISLEVIGNVYENKELLKEKRLAGG